MAEMNIPAKGGRRLQPPRIDLTPMVDLGFLLITFFMFTTALAQQKTMEINMPYKGDVPTPTAFPEESTLTLICHDGHKLYYYSGKLTDDEKIQVSLVKNVNGIVAESKKRTAALPANYAANAHKLHVLIKPTDKSTYADMVALMDAMTIADVKDYAMVDISEEELAAIKHVK